jgi:hypothetical protein
MVIVLVFYRYFFSNILDSNKPAEVKSGNEQGANESTTKLSIELLDIPVLMLGDLVPTSQLC